MKKIWILMAAAVLSCAGPGAPPPHPYQGLVLDSNHIILQVNHPEAFLSQAFETARYFEIPQVQGRDWRESLLLTIDDTDNRRLMAEFLDSVDTSEPWLLGFSIDRNMNNPDGTIIFTLKKDLSEDFNDSLQADGVGVERVGNIMVIRVRSRRAAEAKPLDLSSLPSSPEASFDFFMTTAVPFWPQQLEGFSAVTASLRFMPELELRAAIHAQPGTERSRQLAQVGRLSSGTWDMLNRISATDILGSGSHMDPAPIMAWYKEFFAGLGDGMERLLPIFESMELPEDPRAALGLSFTLPSGALLSAKDAMKTLKLAQWHYTSHSTADPYEQLSSLMESISNLGLGGLDTEQWRDAVAQVPSRTVEQDGKSVRVWNLSSLLKELELNLLVTQIKEGDFYITDMTSQNLAASVSRLTHPSQPGTYPFPEDTEVAVWFDVDRIARLFPSVGMQEPLGKMWFLVTANDRTLESRNIVPKAAVKYFIKLAMATPVR